MSLEDVAITRCKTVREELGLVDNELRAIDQKKILLIEKKRELSVRLEELTNLLNAQTSDVLPEQEYERIDTQKKFLVVTSRPAGGRSSGNETKATLIKVIDASPEKYSTASALSDELLRLGIKSEASNFTHLVRTTLNALRKEGKVAYVQGEGKTVLYTSLKNPNFVDKNNGGMETLHNEQLES